MTQLMSNRSQQSEIFGSSPQHLQLPDATIHYWPEFLADPAAAQLYRQLEQQTQWRQETVRLFGKQHLTPRLSSWVADEGLDYSYSNLTMQPMAWSDALLDIKKIVEQGAKSTFNSVLLNYYRDGRDSNGWHADNEPELGDQPVIASLSLGAARDFHLRHISNKRLRHSINLQHGSLLLMAGTTQSYWQHHIPKRALAGPRINLTFRTIKTASSELSK